MENNNENKSFTIDCEYKNFTINKVPVGFLRHEPTQVNISVYKKIGWFKRLMIDWCFGLKYYEYGK
jgi:hypothetical protein